MATREELTAALFRHQTYQFLEDYQLIRDVAHGPEIVKKEDISGSGDLCDKKLTVIFEKSGQDKINLQPIRNGFSLIEDWLYNSREAPDRSRFKDVYTACRGEFRKFNSALGTGEERYQSYLDGETNGPQRQPPEIRAFPVLLKVLDSIPHWEISAKRSVFMNEINEPLRKIRNREVYTPPSSELIPGNFG